jgi:hypothetical protein
MPKMGTYDGGRKVMDLFPFTIEKGNHGGNYLEEPQERQHSAF